MSKEERMEMNRERDEAIGSYADLIRALMVDMASDCDKAIKMSRRLVVKSLENGNTQDFNDARAMVDNFVNLRRAVADARRGMRGRFIRIDIPDEEWEKLDELLSDTDMIEDTQGA